MRCAPLQEWHNTSQVPTHRFKTFDMSRKFSQVLSDAPVRRCETVLLLKMLFEEHQSAQRRAKHRARPLTVGEITSNWEHLKERCVAKWVLEIMERKDEVGKRLLESKLGEQVEPERLLANLQHQSLQVWEASNLKGMVEAGDVVGLLELHVSGVTLVSVCIDVIIIVTMRELRARWWCVRMTASDVAMLQVRKMLHAGASVELLVNNETSCMPSFDQAALELVLGKLLGKSSPALNDGSLRVRVLPDGTEALKDLVHARMEESRSEERPTSYISSDWALLKALRGTVEYATWARASPDPLVFVDWSPRHSSWEQREEAKEQATRLIPVLTARNFVPTMGATGAGTERGGA